MVQARRFDLQPALVGTRVLGEDLEDHLCAVEHTNLELQLEVALLSRAQVVVADDQVECALELQLAQLVQLAHADEMGRGDPRAPLDVAADDVGAGGPREIGELAPLPAYPVGGGFREPQPAQGCPLPPPPREQSLSPPKP